MGRCAVAVSVIILAALLPQAAEPSEVSIREEPMVIPTYLVGDPDPNPMFYTQESYQGAQKRVYPYPLQDQLTHRREDKTWTALHLENDYIKLTVLPEIGGRLFSATDKTNGYEFFYRQHVIKPALVGMLGAWISGGVEWCAFHHHRNTTFMPVDYTLSENPDGSATIWFGEVERRHRMKWLIGLTLHPDRSYIETTVKLINRTPQPHSILYWANVAVHVNPDYQVIFPPSVQVATHHAKIDFVHWPIARGTYCGNDYAGKNISFYRNLPNPVSFFAWNLQEDFMGGYDHRQQAGVVHVGNHHLMPGAKLWSWGHGATGELWDSILTDTDGPYVELMVGAFSDNQPDYSWIKPYEVKTFKQYWYPVREIGGFKKANLDAAVNLDVTPDKVAMLGFHATSACSGATATLVKGDDVVFQRSIDIAPDAPFTAVVPLSKDTDLYDLRAVLSASDGRELIAYQPVRRGTVDALPDAVEPPPAPEDIDSNEELYLTGLRIEQINNPSVDPLDYYREGIRRDPGDTRCNTILGIHCNKSGLYAQAQQYLKRAIERLSSDYTRPDNTEAYFQLGLAQRAMHEYAQAYDSLYRATWDMAFRAPAYQQLAELSCHDRAFDRALDQIDRSLSANALNPRARDLRLVLLRITGRSRSARALARRILDDDPLDFMARNELHLLRRGEGATDTEALATLTGLMRGDVQSYLELATDYMSAGNWDEAITVLRRPVDGKMDFAATYPLVHYYLGYLHEQKGLPQEARAYYARAATLPSDYCFPFRMETVDVLEAAIRTNPEDAMAYYYLGTMLFEHQPESAIVYWEQSRRLDDTFAPVHRNLGWANRRVRGDIPEAINCYEQAVACDPSDPRLFLELDRLYEIANTDPAKRLALLESHHDAIRRHQDSFLREIELLVLLGRYDDAIRYLTNNHFHAREGGKGIHETYTDAHLLKGLAHMASGQSDQALRAFEQALEAPDNLAAPRNTRRSPEILYHIAMAHDALGHNDKAMAFYRKGADASGSARWPHSLYCRAMCLEKTGRHDAANRVFEDLLESGSRRMNPTDTVDYFAKFGERDTRQARIATGHFMIGLAHLGQGRIDKARTSFQKATELNQSDAWARHYLARLSSD